MLSYKLKLEDVYVKYQLDVMDLTSKFNQEVMKNLGIKYFCMDMKVNDKMYYVKNIPTVMIDMGVYDLSHYIAKQIIQYKIEKGVFDYEKFLLE